MTMNRQFISLPASEDFACLGSECPLPCCIGWSKIAVDSATLGRWTLTADTDTKKFLFDSVHGLGTDDVGMNIDEGRRCLTLDSDNLCTIHLKFGHEYLSKACREFPRVDIQHEYRTYQSGSMACPVIVGEALFDSNNESFFSVAECEDKVPESVNRKNTSSYTLDVILENILSEDKYPIGIVLFFIADIFSKIIKASTSGQLTEQNLADVNRDIDAHLSEITKAVKNKHLQPEPVTSGSFWKGIYRLCESSNIDDAYLDDESSQFVKLIRDDDDSLSSYSKIYAVVKKYKKQSNKKVKQNYTKSLRKFIKMTFVNKGFPLAPRYSHELVLVDCFINICALQLLMWIEFNKKGSISDEFMIECIVELSRKLAGSDRLIQILKKNPGIIEIDKCCNTFLDLF